MALAIVVGAAPAHAQPKRVKDPTFSHRRGFHAANFRLTISSATPGSSLTYTLDGSDPRISSRAKTGTAPVSFTIDPGSDYSGMRPAHKNHAPCVLVRAYAHKSGMADTDIGTHTYVFLDKVAVQDDVRPEGNSTAPDWVFWKSTEMDPDLVGSKYSVNQVKEALQDIPTMSVVTDWDELFEDDGMHTGNKTGARTERPCSIELIYPDLPKYATFDGFQSNALFAIQGAGGRNGNYDHKQSFNLKWRSAYGPANLNYPLFESTPYHADSEAGKYHRITLRAGHNKSWGINWDALRTTYLEDPFVRDLEIAMKGYGSRSTFVHLYLNGIYWGLYNPSEKADLSHLANYFGGDKEDYTYNSGRSGGAGGDTTRYDDWVNNADNMWEDFGKVSDYVDVNNWVDHLLVYGYANIGDGPQHYWGWGSNPGRPVVFSHWDAEESMGYGSRSGAPDPSVLLNGHDKALPGTFSGSVEMRLRFYDRIYKACYNDGALTDDRVLERWDRWSQFIEKAMIGESCRWGDERETVNDPPDEYDNRITGTTLTTDHWATARDGVRNRISGNADDYVQSLRGLNIDGHPLYPDIDPPLFKNSSTEIKVTELTVALGYQLTLENANSGTPGSIKYTLNGQDPHPNGSDGGDSTTITIDKTSRIRARILDGSTWSACHELSIHVNGGQDLSKLKITEIMYNPVHEARAKGVAVSEVEADDSTVENNNEGHPLYAHHENARIRLSSTSGYSGLTGGDKVSISGNSNPLNNGMHTVEDVEGWDSNPKQFGDDIWLTKPLAADGGGGSADILIDGDRYEFIEIKNTGSSTLDLTGCYFSKGVKYRFPAGTQLGAGQFFLLAKNKAHFNSRYPSVTVDGEFDPSNLADSGETLEISSPFGIVTVVSYGNAPPWPVAADGPGKSLVPVSPNPTGSQDDPAQWRASADLNGSPGADDGAS